MAARRLANANDNVRRLFQSEAAHKRPQRPANTNNQRLLSVIIVTAVHNQTLLATKNNQERLSPGQNLVLKEPGQINWIFGQGDDPEQVSNLRNITSRYGPEPARVNKSHVRALKEAHTSSDT